MKVLFFVLLHSTKVLVIPEQIVFRFRSEIYISLIIINKCLFSSELVLLDSRILLSLSLKPTKIQHTTVYVLLSDRSCFSSHLKFIETI